MAELSEQSATPIATIKFYLRERLLPVGEATGPNQARYGDEHVARLRLIRALIDIGGISVAAARDVLTAVDTPDLPLNWVFGTAQLAISQAELYATVAPDSARQRIDELVSARGWQVSEHNPGRVGAANVANAFVQTGHPELLDVLEEYAAAAELVAEADLAAVASHSTVETMAEAVVAGTILGDAMFAALRRIAQEHVSTRRFPVSTPVHPRSSEPENGSPSTAPSRTGEQHDHDRDETTVTSDNA